MVELSDTLTACKIGTLINQLDTRLSSVSGLSDLAAPYIYAGTIKLIRSYDLLPTIFTADDELYTQLTGWGVEESCLEIGFRMGKITSLSLDFKAPDNVYYNDV